MELELGEGVSGLTIEDFDLTNATVKSLSEIDTGRYLVVVESGDGDQPVSVRVPDNAFEDKAGNMNAASNIFSWHYDVSGPLVSLTSDQVALDGVTSRDQITLQLNSSEPLLPDRVEDDLTVLVTGEMDADVVRSITPSADKTRYDVVLDTRELRGLISVSLPKDALVDDALNEAARGVSYEFKVDHLAPRLEVTPTDGASGIRVTTDFKVGFSEPVFGPDGRALSADNAAEFVALTHDSASGTSIPFDASVADGILTITQKTTYCLSNGWRWWCLACRIWPAMWWLRIPDTMWLRA